MGERGGRGGVGEMGGVEEGEGVGGKASHREQ